MAILSPENHYSKGIQGTASAQLRMNQEWFYQMENRWVTEQALTQ
jgi:hypothetical protein